MFAQLFKIYISRVFAMWYQISLCISYLKKKHLIVFIMYLYKHLKIILLLRLN